MAVFTDVMTSWDIRAEFIKNVMPQYIYGMILGMTQLWFINPVNIIISYNVMPKFPYTYALLISYHHGNISRKKSAYAQFLVSALPILSAFMVMNILFSSPDFGFIRQVHSV